MFCGKCGNPLNENAAFCGKCGEPVKKEKTTAEEPAVQESVAEQTAPAVEQSAAEQPAVQETEPLQPEIGTFASGEFDQEPPTAPAPKKKKSKLWLKIGIPAVAVVAAAALVLVNLGVLKGTAVKWFGSDSDYFAYVEANAVSDIGEAVASTYEAVTLAAAPMLGTSSAGTIGYEGEMKLVLGQALTSLLSATGQADFSWLDEIGVKFDVASTDAAQSVKYSLNLGEKALLNIEMVTDPATSQTYLRIPELSTSYIVLPSSADAAYDSDVTAEVQAFLETYGEMLPSKETLQKMLDKYLRLVVDNLNNVTSSTQDVQAGGVTQNVTVLNVNVSEKDLMQLAVVLLKEVKNDQDIKALIEETMQTLSDQGLTDGDTDAYANFTQAIDELIAQVEGSADGASEEALLTLRDFVNGKHEIIGRQLIVSGESLLYYIAVQDGKDIAIDCEIADTVLISGTGTKDGDVVNAELDVTVDENEIFALSCKDFNMKNSTGTIRLELGEDLMDEMGAGAMSMMSLGVEFVFNGGNSMEVNFMSGKSMLFGFAISMQEKSEVGSVELPDSSQAVNVQDMTALGKWFASLDFDAFFDDLEAAGLPSDIVDMLRSSLTGDLLGGSFGMEDMYDSYEDDYLDDYDEYLDDDYFDDFSIDTDVI